MAFTGTSGFSIEGGANNYVQGNQIITSTTQHQEKERTIYDEFYNIKLGAICRVQDIYCEEYPRRLNVGIKEGRCLRVDRTISTADIRGEHGSRFTVVSYSGPERKNAWKDDFRWFSKATDAAKMQLFGINRSSIPLLIFYGELAPLGHFWDSLGWSGGIYVSTLSLTLGCREREIWIDPKQGTLIHGLEGPHCDLIYRGLKTVRTLPSSTKHLQEDVCFRYFSRLPLVKDFDDTVISVLQSISHVIEEIVLTANQTYAYILSSLTSSVIAIGSGGWRTFTSFDSRVVMPDGRTRFTLTEAADEVSSFRLCSDQFDDWCAWLPQAWSVFHKHGVSFNEDPSTFKLISPYIKLRGSFKHSKVKQQRRREGPCIYFFLHPLHLFLLKAGTAMSIHAWSFDKNGHGHISHEYCRYLGLPTKLWVETLESYKYSWTTESYKSIHKWQVARGFDPTTTDFVTYLGYPVYGVVSTDSKEPTDAYTSSVAEISRKDDFQGQSTIRSVWSALTAPFAYAASEDSEISAVLM